MNLMAREREAPEMALARQRAEQELTDLERTRTQRLAGLDRLMIAQEPVLSGISLPRSCSHQISKSKHSLAPSREKPMPICGARKRLPRKTSSLSRWLQTDFLMPISSGSVSQKLGFEPVGQIE